MFPDNETHENHETHDGLEWLLVIYFCIAGLVVLFFLVGLGGCIGAKTGQKTTVFYDQSGNPTHAETVDVPINKYGSYSGSVAEVSRNKKESVAAKANAISTLASPHAGDTKEAIAYKTAIATFAIAMIDDDPSKAIAVIHYGKDVHDNIDTGLGVAGKVITGGIVTYGATEVTKAVISAVGDTITTTGDGNEVTKTATTTETHATSVGDNSPPTSTVDQSTVHPVSEEKHGELEYRADCSEESEGVTCTSVPHSPSPIPDNDE